MYISRSGEPGNEAEYESILDLKTGYIGRVCPVFCYCQLKIGILE